MFIIILKILLIWLAASGAFTMFWIGMYEDLNMQCEGYNNNPRSDTEIED